MVSVNIYLHILYYVCNVVGTLVILIWDTSLVFVLHTVVSLILLIVHQKQFFFTYLFYFLFSYLWYAFLFLIQKRFNIWSFFFFFFSMENVFCRYSFYHTTYRSFIQRVSKVLGYLFNSFALLGHIDLKSIIKKKKMEFYLL